LSFIYKIKPCYKTEYWEVLYWVLVQGIDLGSILLLPCVSEILFDVLFVLKFCL